MLVDIRLLSPSPLQLNPPASETLRTPELVFDHEEDGIIKVYLNETALPQMLTDDAMFSSFKAIETDQNAMAYCHDCYRGTENFSNCNTKKSKYPTSNWSKYFAKPRKIYSHKPPFG